MNKNLFYKILASLLFVAIAVLWLLSVILPEKFGNINLAWMIAIFAGGMGIIFILKGIFQKNLTTIKKFNIFFGSLFIIAAILALVGTFIQSNWVLPIIAVILTTAILLSVLAVGGKKWDSGDNQQVGYKNYYQRKKEQEKEENKKDNN